MVEGADEREQPFFAQLLAPGRIEVVRQPQERLQPRNVPAERKPAELREGAVEVVVDAGAPVETEKVRNVAALELHELRVEKRWPRRARPREHVVVGATQADSN